MRPANPALGVLIFVLGGLAGAVFYLPFKKVKNWAWESYWFDLRRGRPGRRAVGAGVLHVAQRGVGAQGGARQGTRLLLPLRGDVGRRRPDLGTDDPLPGRRPRAGHRLRPVLGGRHADSAVVSSNGRVSAAAACDDSAGRPVRHAVGCAVGVLVSLVGIVLVGGAGMSKESELPEEEKKAAVAEFNFKMGMLVAIFSGLMSAGMSFGLQGGASHREAGTNDRAGHQRHLERHARAGRRAARRIRRQRRLVPVPERQEQDDGRLRQVGHAAGRPTSSSPAWPAPSGARSSSASRRASRRWASWPTSAGRC